MNPEKRGSGAEQPARFLVVDDTPANLQLLAVMRKDRGYTRTGNTSTPRKQVAGPVICF